MGGEKFETPQPEAYLFGENSDLNFLSSKPAQVRASFASHDSVFDQLCMTLCFLFLMIANDGVQHFLGDTY